MYGNFSIEGVRVLKRFYYLKLLRGEVFFEKIWLLKVFKNSYFVKEVIEVLLD